MKARAQRSHEAPLQPCVRGRHSLNSQYATPLVPDADIDAVFKEVDADRSGYIDELEIIKKMRE